MVNSALPDSGRSATFEINGALYMIEHGAENDVVYKWDGSQDDWNWENPTALPDPNLTIELVGDNSIATNFTEEEISSDEGGYHCLTFGGVNATITGSGTLAATAQASNDGCAILICEDGSLTITGDAAVSARVKGEDWGWEDEDGNPVKR